MGLNILLAAGIVLVLLGSTEAYTCYNCRYMSSANGTWQNASCTEPFSPTGVPTCQGTVCVSTWANFTSAKGVVLNRSCMNSTQSFSVDQCLQLNNSTNNTRKYFRYLNQCCFATPNMTNPGDPRLYDQMTCWCTADSCNGFVSYPIVPTTNQTTAAPLGTTSKTYSGTTCSQPISVMLMLPAVAFLGLAVSGI